MWIDSHCHLDAAEFDDDRDQVVHRARAAGVSALVLPAIEVANFDTVRLLAHQHDAVYALGIHPLYVDRAAPHDLERLQQALHENRHDARLVAVGEIGLDYFVPGFDAERQSHFYLAQLKLARAAGLPVILHVRRSADALLQGLRRIELQGGITHAFNGSAQQATQFVERGFCLGFGGAMTFDRALQIRTLARHLPATALVLETDAPDIPPHWLYLTAQQRAGVDSQVGQVAQPQARNQPSEWPRIGAELAALRGWGVTETAQTTAANTRRVLPRLAPSWPE